MPLKPMMSTEKLSSEVIVAQRGTPSYSAPVKKIASIEKCKDLSISLNLTNVNMSRTPPFSHHWLNYLKFSIATSADDSELPLHQGSGQLGVWKK